MAKTKVLITVKTYPTLSAKYDELVCTAGFTESGEFIRIYPVPFRKNSYEQQYKKYEWIELDLVKNTGDFRPESYKPTSFNDNIRRLEKVDTSHNWAKRKKIVLNNVYSDLSLLIEEAKNKEICTSLAVFKPTKIKEFVIETVDREWSKKKIDTLLASKTQGVLFEHPENPFEIVKKLPYKFSYKFEDSEGRESKMMIEDWELGALYWKALARYGGDEHEATQYVKKQYFDNFVKTKDLYLFLGTTKEHHGRKAKNPFIIIGVFYPKIDNQINLF